jgi:hypothetical protein
MTGEMWSICSAFIVKQGIVSIGAICDRNNFGSIRVLE